MTCLTLPPQGLRGDGLSECVATSRAGPAYALDRRTQQGEGELAWHPGQRDAVGLVRFLCEHGGDDRERERAPTLLEIVYVGAYVRTYVRPCPTARLRMRERCSNSAEFRNQLVL